MIQRQISLCVLLLGRTTAGPESKHKARGSEEYRVVGWFWDGRNQGDAGVIHLDIEVGAIRGEGFIAEVKARVSGSRDEVEAIRGPRVGQVIRAARR